ncbi:MAG: SBBP repeat-containing protein [Candidatus Kapabacteria bacterium]|nr:SBBP repeat-containing protein [Ignavibacteriota bacterium]MCW5884401.1 SBBP repeat-containing protein [Candidatus Kapabacteria bacterium]
MKYIFITLFLCVGLNLYSQTWEFLEKPEILKNGKGYSTHDQTFGIIEDGSGNLYHTGYFEGEIQFGNSNLSSVGNRDLYIAKINKSGGWDWAVSAGGASTDFSRSIAADNNGNLFITGYYFGTCIFGSHSLTAQNNSDIFVAKLSPAGVWLWARTASGGGFNRGNSITCDNVGNAYITGSFESSVSFGSISISSFGSRDIFAAKINSSGNWIWAKKAGGTGSEDGVSIKYSSNDNFVAVTGFYSSNSAFGQINLAASGGRDIFVSRIDTSGNWVWAKSAASSGAEEAKALTVDNSGNILITGYYSSALTIGLDNLPAGQGRDIFVAKLNKSGDWLWARYATGADTDEANAIGVDNSGNAYITGSFYSDLTINNNTLNASSDRNLFVARISSSGSWVWGRAATGSSTVDGNGISVMSNGVSYIAGAYFENATFGSTTLTSKGDSDILIASISATGNWNWAHSNAGLTGIVTGDGVAVDSSGSIIYVGSFYGDVKFGNTTLSSNGGKDIYVAKYTPQTGWNWAKSFGGTSDDVANSVCTDAANNIYITGNFLNSISFGSNNHNSNGFNDIYIVKLSETGNVIWSQTTGDNEFDEGVAIINKGDKIYLTGTYSRRPYFGATRLNARGNEEIFITKMDTSGTYLWAISAGGGQFDYPRDIFVDKFDNVLLTGGFETTCYFDNITVSSNGGDDIFAAKADSEGIWKWAVRAGTTNFQESGWGITSDEFGNVYFVSSFRALCLFGSEYILHKGQSDFALSKLDSNGNWIWSKGYGDQGVDIAYNLNYFNGRLTMSGAVSSTFMIGSQQFKAYGTRNGFLASFDSEGEILWARSDEGLGYSEFRKLVVDNNNSAHLIGNYMTSAQIGNFSVSESNSVDKNALFTTNGFSLPKPEWTFRDSTGKSAVVSIPKIINPKVNGRNLAAGDAVGLFYMRNNNFYCAGMEYWKGEDLNITIWGNDTDTPIKDGFDDNETLNLLVWDALKAEEILTKVRLESGPDKFNKDSTTVILQLPIVYDTLKISLNQGWNMISSFCYPREKLLDSIFVNIKNSITIAKSSSGSTYLPLFNINTIGNWNIKEGYQVFANQNTELIVEGDFIEPEDNAYNLNAGWTIISYLRKTPMNAATAFQSLAESGKLVIVKSNEGGNYLPMFQINTIGNLQPGKAYQIYLNASAEFTYPAND